MMIRIFLLAALLTLAGTVLAQPEAVEPELREPLVRTQLGTPVETWDPEDLDTYELAEVRDAFTLADEAALMVLTWIFAPEHVGEQRFGLETIDPQGQRGDAFFNFEVTEAMVGHELTTYWYAELAGRDPAQAVGTWQLVYFFGDKEVGRDEIVVEAL